MNGNNIEYAVLFGDDKYNPDLHIRAAKRKFNYIKDARVCADAYQNAHIFKCQYDGKTGDLIDISEVY